MVALGHGPTETRDGFRAAFDTDPDGVWAAPGRVNLIGEHTDYNDGFVLPLALPHSCLVAARRRDDGVLRLHSGDRPEEPVRVAVADLRPGDNRDLGWAAYPAGVAWALREAGLPVGGADVHVRSTVPTGAGLSSSAALEVSTGLALCDLYGVEVEPQRLALVCQRAENAFVGVPCGIMDQTASACCTAGHALFLDTRDLGKRRVPLELEREGLRLLVVDTRVRHDLADGAYAARRAGCERAAALLGVPALRDVGFEELDAALGRLDDPALVPLVRHVVTDNRRVRETVELLESGRTREVGPVLYAGHASLRDDFAVSCPELDLVVSAAGEAGALGARMTGGGFGGSALVLVEAERAESVGEAVVAAFSGAGFVRPRVFTVVAGEGARRVG
ncbi:galactokinase [Streptomyces sp. NPDC005438]|uniref:galactokinase n=1 Tax=Streptomyces sp. NPDC005438 TaxID=3156880 RepID=UPI0033A30589